ncbi:MAG: Ger(x)C family spore germination C-terminal domain-containing protein [Eubacteriaceae bacterium]
MKNVRKILVIFLLINTILLCGCWNYNEIDKLAVVAGVAIDKGIDKNYSITVEIIKLQTGGMETNIKSEIISEEGDTVFDAVRGIIALIGEKLYWSNVETEVAIAELGNTVDYSDDIVKKEISECIEKNIENDIGVIIKKIQMEYGIDIFGFGNKIYKEMPKVWRLVEDGWGNTFKDIDVEVSVEISIKNSALISEPMKIGD